MTSKSKYSILQKKRFFSTEMFFFCFLPYFLSCFAMFQYRNIDYFNQKKLPTTLNTLSLSVCACVCAL